MTPKLKRFIKEQNLAYRAEFVPYSQVPAERRASWGKDPTLNWRVTLSIGEREVLSTDYTLGCGHCSPAAQKLNPKTVAYRDAVAFECERGYHAADRPAFKRPLVFDSFDGFLIALALDATVLNYPTFEDWAVELGYDVDSRKAEKTYRACLDIALKLRAGLGAAFETFVSTDWEEEDETPVAS